MLIPVDCAIYPPAITSSWPMTKGDWLMPIGLPKLFPTIVAFPTSCLNGSCCFLKGVRLPTQKQKSGRPSAPIRMYWLSSLAIPLNRSLNTSGLIWRRLVSRRISPIRISQSSYLISISGWKRLWPANSLPAGVLVT